MSLEWSDDLILGVEPLDRQHRAMFDHFNRLSLACHGPSAAPVLKELDSLVELVRQHIETEELLMAESGYQAVDTQRGEHEEFAAHLAELRHMALTSGPSRLLGARVAGDMVHWIVHHIRHHDAELARQIRLRQSV